MIRFFGIDQLESTFFVEENHFEKNRSISQEKTLRNTIGQTDKQAQFPNKKALK
jgi:hypothetical protein